MSALAVAFAVLLASQPDDSAARRAAVTRSLVGPISVKGVRFALEDRMREVRLPGCAIAVLREFEIDWVAGFGVRDAFTGAPVTADTMFQAASISKSVFATAVHRLAQEKKIALDADVRVHLKRWALPENEFSKAHALTPERLLSHTGSVTVHGFLGYSIAEPIPTLPQILSGASPANSPPVLMDGEPGAFRYAGGGTTILQLAVEDLTGKPLPRILEELVFEPLGMAHSTFEQPLPVTKYPDFATGHIDDGAPIGGRFQIHPELAAAGLWVSARDLAMLVREWLLAANGRSERVLTRDTFERMATPLAGAPTSAGFFLENHGGSTYFQHGGSNVGFKCVFYGNAESGDGLVYLSNGDAGQSLIPEIVGAVAEVYGWSGFTGAESTASPPPADETSALEGRYELRDETVAEFAREGDDFTVRIPPHAARKLHRLDVRTYLCLDRSLLDTGDVTRFEFEEPEDGVCEGLNFKSGELRDYALRAEDDERTIGELAAAGDVQGAIARLRALHAASRDADRPRIEERIDRAAREALHAGDIAFARAATELNLELFPDSIAPRATLVRIARVSRDEALLIESCRALIALAERGEVDTRAYPVTAARAMLAERGVPVR
jgi:CubicO group peptidase (beta-lactamase class C family)